MAPQKLPPESVPRRSPSGGFLPITIHVGIQTDESYLPRYLPAMGGPFRTLTELEDAVRARYAAVYLTWHRRNRPQDPPPSRIHHILQLEFEVEYVGQRPTPSAPQRLQDVSSLKTTKLEEESSGSTATSSRQSDQDTLMATSTPSGNCRRSRIWAWLRRDWGFTFYIRVDLGEAFHTYPDAGGPFRSLEEATSAMDRYFHEHRDPKLLMNQGGVSSVEIAIEKAIFWPDGTRKNSRSHMIEQTRNKMRQLLLALVDKHNEDHELWGDLAYELKDVVHYQQFWEKRTWYYHLNFTMSKEAGIKNLFFAEVKTLRQGKQQELLVSCLCMLKPTDAGHCYGCTNKGNINIKHPTSADEYIAGHSDMGSPFGCSVEFGDSDDDDDVEAKKRELRWVFTGVEDPDAENLSMLPPDAALLEV